MQVLSVHDFSWKKGETYVMVTKLTLNKIIMKKKPLPLPAAMAVASLTANAQFVFRNELPIITATEATEVDDYGFTANWIPITDDEVLMESKALGYYVRVYAAKTAKKAGEKFYFINTDFSFIKS